LVNIIHQIVIMTSSLLSVRPYQSTADLQPIADLLNLCEAIDQEDSYYSSTDLQAGYEEPGFDPSQNVRLWETADRSHPLIAYADLWTPPEVSAADPSFDGFLWFRVHPAYRWQGIEAEILAWAETRLKQIRNNTEAVRDLPVRLLSGCRDTQTAKITFYEQYGFESERCFLTMTRSLAGEIPDPVLPARFKVIQTRGAEDAAAWVEMHNQTFIDHWQFHPSTVEDHLYWLSTPKYCPELDLVAVSPEGCFAAFCYGQIDAEYNQQKQRREGWISSLGTRRGFRRQGLARAMLLVGLQKLQAFGMDTAKLSVDTQNPNSAQTLYESVGFRQLHTHLTYVRSVTL
jgi:mycothiol synthase